MISNIQRKEESEKMNRHGAKEGAIETYYMLILHTNALNQ
jgi:hypothetical protein